MFTYKHVYAFSGERVNLLQHNTQSSDVVSTLASPTNLAPGNILATEFTFHGKLGANLVVFLQSKDNVKISLHPYMGLLSSQYSFCVPLLFIIFSIAYTIVNAMFIHLT